MRKIEPKMVDFLETKLDGNGLYAQAVREKNARLVFVLAMQACVGIQEKTGRNDGEMVELIQETVGGANGEPWCAALVQTCIAFAEVKTGVKSPITASELCYDIWHKTPKSQRVKFHPLAGALAVWNDVGKTSGHIEMVLSCDDKSFQAVGGNTSGTTKPGSAVNREGNGCYFTVRSRASTKKRVLLGFVKPF